MVKEELVMKDYKLSEIKAMCERHQTNCGDCEFSSVKGLLGKRCLIIDVLSPEDWNINEEQPKQEDKDNEKNN